MLRLSPPSLNNESQWNQDTGGGTEAGQRCSPSSFTLVPRAKAALFGPIYGSEGSKVPLSLHRMCDHGLSRHTEGARAQTLASLIGILGPRVLRVHRDFLFILYFFKGKSWWQSCESQQHQDLDRNPLWASLGGGGGEKRNPLTLIDWTN